MSNVSEITVEQIEVLADRLIAERESARARLIRLIVAEARIVGVRCPEKFGRKPIVYRDETGVCDGSYPPDQEYSDYTGPRLAKILGRDTEQSPTSGGFYYDYRIVTTFGGIYVDSDTESDTGIPFLSDIPLLGWLFKSNAKLKTKTELLIFITPKVVL